MESSLAASEMLKPSQWINMMSSRDCSSSDASATWTVCTVKADAANASALLCGCG